MKNFLKPLSIVSAVSVIRGDGDLIELSYQSQADIPAAYVELYTEKDGKWVLTGVKGMKTQDDINRQLQANQKIREELKQAKQVIAKFGDLDPEEVIAKLDRVEELEAQLAAGGGKTDEERINSLVEARLKARLTPLEREKARLASELAERNKVLGEYSQKERQRTISDQLRAAATKANVRSTALEDILLIGQHVFEVTDDGIVQTKDGVPADVWLNEQQNNRPHWWPESNGTGAAGGAGGGNFKNPFSAEHWNLTEQGRLYNQNPAKAEQYAKAAGTSIGGKKPVK